MHCMFNATPVPKQSVPGAQSASPLQFSPACLVPVVTQLVAAPKAEFASTHLVPGAGQPVLVNGSQLCVQISPPVPLSMQIPPGAWQSAFVAQYFAQFR